MLRVPGRSCIKALCLDGDEASIQPISQDRTFGPNMAAAESGADCGQAGVIYTEIAVSLSGMPIFDSSIPPHVAHTPSNQRLSRRTHFVRRASGIRCSISKSTLLDKYFNVPGIRGEKSPPSDDMWLSNLSRQ